MLPEPPTGVQRPSSPLARAQGGCRRQTRAPGAPSLAAQPWGDPSITRALVSIGDVRSAGVGFSAMPVNCCASRRALYT